MQNKRGIETIEEMPTNNNKNARHSIGKWKSKSKIENIND